MNKLIAILISKWKKVIGFTFLFILAIKIFTNDSKSTKSDNSVVLWGGKENHPESIYGVRFVIFISIMRNNFFSNFQFHQQHHDQLFDKEAEPLTAIENDLLYRAPIDIALIFTNGNDNINLQYSLQKCISSMMKHTSTPINLHLISDEKSFEKAKEIIADIQSSQHLELKHLKV